MDWDDAKGVLIFFGFAFLALILLSIIGMGIDAGSTSYSVWSKGKSGQAELAKADYNRKIAIREAAAKAEAAKYLAQADIIRAQGIAKANKIIGDSLKTNEKYLEWKFIDELPQNKNQIIYLPTKSVLPILEATRNQSKNEVGK